MPTAFIGLGSNLGDRLKNLTAATSLISQQCRIISKSSVYETVPWGFSDQPKFLNMVIEIETKMKPFGLLVFLQDIEKKLGRSRNAMPKIQSQRWGPRIIDLDILLYSNGLRNIELKTDDLILPHSHLKERAFVLVPLYEINKEAWIRTALGRLSEEEKEGVKLF
jgi:2-amino-4-hydroxy-6-hydroxymethyldihydropteridine diphosphokinase